MGAEIHFYWPCCIFNAAEQAWELFDHFDVGFVGWVCFGELGLFCKKLFLQLLSFYHLTLNKFKKPWLFNHTRWCQIAERFNHFYVSRLFYRNSFQKGCKRLGIVVLVQVDLSAQVVLLILQWLRLQILNICVVAEFVCELLFRIQQVQNSPLLVANIDNIVHNLFFFYSHLISSFLVFKQL